MALKILGPTIAYRIERRYTFIYHGKNYDVIVHPKYIDDLNKYITLLKVGIWLMCMALRKFIIHDYKLHFNFINIQQTFKWLFAITAIFYHIWPEKLVCK